MKNALQNSSKGHDPFQISASFRAPAKLILLGEHAVLLGCPALVQAVAIYTQATLTCRKEGLSILCPFGSIFFEKGRERVWPQALKWLELLLEALDLSKQLGFCLTLKRDPLMTSGMGSSASVVVSTLFSLKEHFNISLSFEKAFEIAKKCESACHGISSGIDVAASLYGGSLLFQQGQAKKTESLDLENIYWISTGEAISQTSECVHRTQKFFEENSHLTSEIEMELERAILALRSGSFQDQVEVVSLWNRRLIQMGIVPKKVKSLIEAIEVEKGAAKISGAGSVQGDGAGVILVWAKKELASKLKKKGYQLHQLQPAKEGVYDALI